MGVPVKLEIDHDLDSSIYIFDVKFECKVRSIDMISDEELKFFGTFETGMKSMNDVNNTQMVYVNLSISEIASHVAKGLAIQYAHVQDVLKLYEFTQHHLQRWISYLSEGSLNKASAPIEDLIKLDTFCSEIYEKAKFFDIVTLNSIDERFGTKASFSHVVNMFSNKQPENNKIEEKLNRHRKGFSELFREFQIDNSDRLEGRRLGKSLNEV